MLIDWFTVIAQALNFLILVWLMKRFLYKPILNAIDAREKRIALALAEADAQKAEALQEKNDFRHKNEQFAQQRLELIEKATDEANAEGQRLLAKARQASDDFSAKRQDAWQREQQSLNDEITRRTQDEVFAIVRKTLTDLADENLEERMCEVFRHRLLELNDEMQKNLAGSLQTSSAPVFVRSAFLLPPTQQEAIRQTLNETFSTEINVSFETVPELISGIELTTNGQKLAWSITDYLTSLERNVSEILQEQTKPHIKQQANLDEKIATETEPDSDFGAPPAVPEEAK
ncbi:MAG: F-type H+-transporting ATPase subunit b [Desulforhopalus sp.]|jgi:F-type H+-transporting ATPase subunit b